MWTIIEECLNPPVVWERERATQPDGSVDVEAGFFTLPPFAEPEVFDFPEGIGPVECVHVEHEEVLLMPRWVEAQRVTFKYGLGEEMIAMLRQLRALGLDSADSMRDFGAQCVVWQTAINPVVALELLAKGEWSGTGVLGPEALPPKPFLDLLAAPKPEGYGSPWGLDERTP